MLERVKEKGTGDHLSCAVSLSGPIYRALEIFDTYFGVSGICVADLLAFGKVACTDNILLLPPPPNDFQPHFPLYNNFYLHLENCSL